jgi:predicted PurR-regulated permease PerM
MTVVDAPERARKISSATIDLAIRIGFVGLLGYWSFRVVLPFVTIGLWSALLATALYPLYIWLTQYVRPHLAAVLVTLLCLLMAVGPVTWLGFGMVSGFGSLVAQLNGGQPAIPLPPEAVKAWPLVGERVFQLWTDAANNLKAVLAEQLPLLKPIGGKLLEIAQGALVGLLELVVSIVIAGFLFPRGPQMVEVLSVLLGRALSLRGKELAELAGATVRNVSRGVIGIALLQSLLAGAGFLAAGLPAPSVLAFMTLLLGVLQIGPAILFAPIVIWSWTSMEPAQAIMFTAYMVPVGLIDNILRPLLLARGLATPIPVIMVGVIGGAIAYGIIGLFFGPVVLSVAWAVVVAWIESGDATGDSAS